MVWALGFDADSEYNEPLLGVIRKTLSDSSTTAVNVSFNKIYSFYLSDNYPNPFNPSTVIKFSIPKEGWVSLKVFNIVGQLVTTLLSKEVTAGYHQAEFNGDKLSSGIYLYMLSYNGLSQTKKMILLK